MQTFKLTTGLLVLTAKSVDVGMVLLKKLRAAYPLVVSECEQRPDAVYETVLVEAMKRVQP